MKIIYQNKPIILDDKDELGSGGEAIVIKNNNLAFKIYHSPSKEKTQKLIDFISHKFQLPNNVAAPIDLVNDTKGRTIGFTMPIAKNCQVFMILSNKKERTQKQINTNQVIEAFLHVKETLDLIHQQKLIVGDFNDLNLLLNDQFQSIFIDVDSYQFDKYPCPVGTDIFIDPNLIGIDLSKKPCFSKETDWYSFSVMLFKSLLFVHPYGGIHKTIVNMIDRMQKKVPVYHKSVIYPKIGFPIETIDDDLLHFFDNIFSKGQRLDLSSSILNGLIGTFIKCGSCGLYYSQKRSNCPGCKKISQQQTPIVLKPIQTVTTTQGKCIVKLVFEGADILFIKICSGKINVISYNGKITKLTIIEPNFSLRSYHLWDGHKRTKFDFFDHYLVICNSDIIQILDTSRNMTKILETTSMLFKEDMVFTGSDKYFYRLTNNTILKGSIQHNNLVEQMISTAMTNQTWITVGQNDLGLGFYKIFGKYQYFIFSPDGKFELSLDRLPGQLIEQDIRISAKTILLLRKTIDKGRTYSHFHILDNEGKVLQQMTEESLNSIYYKDIFGKELFGTNILHPTDDGIVIEKQRKADLKVATKDHVDGDSSLLIYQRGILVVSDKKILYLELI